jgi:hypothetical protein
MADEPNLPAILERICTSAKDAGSLVVDAVIKPNLESGVLVADLDLDDFVGLLAHCKPRALYLRAEKFEAEVDALDLLDLDSEDEDARIPLLKTVVKRWTKRDGEISGIYASFMLDGVHNIYVMSPDWYDEFDEQVEEVAEAIREVRSGRVATQREGITQIIKGHARKLRKNPHFNAIPKPSREKRMYLAREVFPGLDDMVIQQVVDEAINMEWLESGRP